MKKLILFIFLLSFLNSFAQCFTNVLTRQNHNVAKKDDGTLWVWGWGVWGQLGDVNGTDSNSPNQLSNDNDWNKITSGTFNTFVIKNNGSLWGTGRNQNGDLGINSNTNIYELTQVGTANNWKKVSGGDLHTVGIKTDGTIWAWGWNYYHQVGDNTTIDRLVPVQISTTSDWKTIETTLYGPSFALKYNGTLWGWGPNGPGLLGDSLLNYRAIPTQHNTDTDWNDFVLGGNHILALKNNGTLWSWGGTDRGETGDGPASIFRYVPAQIGTDNDWKFIAAGEFNSFGIKNNGTLWAWGFNDAGQLGNGNTTTQYYPIQIGTDTNWASVNSGYQHTVALKTDGSLWAWGNNDFGQLGDGTNVSTLIPTQISVAGCNLGNEEFENNNNFSINPNPAQNTITITTQQTINEIKIYNTLGQLVQTTTGNTKTLDVSQLKSGNYFLKIGYDGIVSSERFIKE